MEENYSIQAKNLLDNLIDEYENVIREIHRIDILLKKVKSIRVNINNRTRWISEVANITKETANKKVRILIYNEDYVEPIKEELDLLDANYKITGQFIDVIQPDFNYNELMELVDDIDSKKNKILSKCSKAKMDPVIRSKNALENDFIEPSVARKTSDKCQIIFEDADNKIKKVTLEKIKSILGIELFKRYQKEII